MSVNDGVVAEVAIIGGSGFYEFPDMKSPKEVFVKTPYSDVLGISVGAIGHKKVAFMPRHGVGHRLPPHKINYRANLWALKSLGVKKIIALNAVGGIDASMPPGAMVLPNQIIDYTHGREHTYVDLLTDELNHIDFSSPFSQNIYSVLDDVLGDSGVELRTEAVYGCTQGPRLESAAEINRLERDGCHIVGMTAMPEAALARELGLDYGMICTVVNWAAGRSDQEITLDQIYSILNGACPVLRQALVAAVIML